METLDKIPYKTIRICFGKMLKKTARNFLLTLFLHQHYLQDVKFYVCIKEGKFIQNREIWSLIELLYFDYCSELNEMDKSPSLLKPG